MVYSQGFSPHPIMSFALPLGLGLSSEGEYLDAEIEDGFGLDEVSPPPAPDGAPSPASGGGQAKVVDKVLSCLRAATSDELPVYAVRVLPEKAGNAMASVGRAAYRLEIPAEFAPAIAAAAETLLAESSHIISKKTKTQTVSFDLRPCIYELTCRSASLFMTLAAGSKANVKPELVWEELCRIAALTDGAKPFAIRRLDLMTEDGTSLGDIGE